MKQVLIILLITLCFKTNIYSQLYGDGKTLPLKHHSKIYQDSSSKDLLLNYKNIAGLRVLINDLYEFEDLKIFKLAPNLKKISIYSNALKSLSGLEYLQNLETLSIRAECVEDYSVLNNLKNIKRLTLNTKVKIDFPLNYDSLTSLNYSCNYEIGRCNFPQLEYLNIHQTIAHETKVNHYNYDNYENYGVEYSLEKPCCPIELANFDSLHMVNIYDMHTIKDISEITFPHQLKKLRITNCRQLLNLDKIKELTFLENLTIAFCDKVQNFEFLREMKNLKWKVRYMGRVYQNETFEQLINHPGDVYFYADEKEIVLDNGSFYNFHPSVIEKAKVIFKKYHGIILKQNLSRKEFLDLIPSIIEELNKLCTEETCNIDWADEESDYLIYFLIDMSHFVDYEFDESHFYARFE